MVKNTLKLSMLALLIFIPMGMPDDFIIIPAIIAAIGLQAYIILTTIIIIYLYNSIHGNTLNDKLNTVRREIKQIFRR